MSVSAQDVKKLRDLTSAGMMDCKKALQETDGDFDAAVEWLQVKGITKAQKKSDRVAAEGLVHIWQSEDGRAATLVEVNCETDFVARNEDFIKFVEALTQAIGQSGAGSVDELSGVTFEGKSVEETLAARTATIGENLKLRRVARVSVDDGVLGVYIHAGSQIGVVTKVTGESGEKAEQFARDIAMHAAAMKPSYLTPEDVTEEEVSKQTEIFEALVREEGKPEKMVPQIVAGKIRKWRNELALLEQPFVKNPELSVRKYQEEVGGVTLEAFVRFEVGEGVEKQESNLADEVAATLKG